MDKFAFLKTLNNDINKSVVSARPKLTEGIKYEEYSITMYNAKEKTVYIPTKRTDVFESEIENENILTEKPKIPLSRFLADLLGQSSVLPQVAFLFPMRPFDMDVDRGEQPELTGGRDLRQVLAARQNFRQLGRLGGQMLQYLFLFQDVQRCKGSRGCQRIASVGMPVKESFLTLARGWKCWSQEGVVDFLGGQRGSQRQVAARDAFAQAHQIGNHMLLFAGEHAPCSAKRGHDFIGDQQDIVLMGQMAHSPQVAFGVHDHAGRALDQGFDDHRRDFFVPFGE